MLTRHRVTHETPDETLYIQDRDAPKTSRDRLETETFTIETEPLPILDVIVRNTTCLRRQSSPCHISPALSVSKQVSKRVYTAQQSLGAAVFSRTGASS